MLWMVERVVFTDAEEEKDCHGDVLVELLEKMKRGELEVARWGRTGSISCI